VIPILVGDELHTVEFAAALRERGVLVCPAIPPMVQAHLSRVRAHVTAAHDEPSLVSALATIDGAADGVDFPRRYPRVASKTASESAASRAAGGGMMLRRVS